MAKAGKQAWWWIPTLYFGQGIPYVVVMMLAVVLYKNLGVSNTEIALYTSWLYLPWVIKPLWSPLVDMFRTKREWIWGLQLVIGVSLALVALTIPAPHFLQMTLAVFWLMAFSSATHDIAADGFYLLALPEQQQAAFVGVRSTFYRIAMIAGQGGLVFLAGQLIEVTGDAAFTWSVVFAVLSALFFVLFAYHRWVLPYPVQDVAVRNSGNPLRDFAETFRAFFQRKDIVVVLAFLLTFRLGEAQALKLVTPFLLDPLAEGGLGLSTKDVGVVYGTVGVLALTVGGLLGGYMVSRSSLQRWLWPMLLAVHVPNIVFVYLAVMQPASHAIISAAIALEQFGYGFGFTAYMLFMIQVAKASGLHQTAHYAICTGFMALGMMLPGMVSGWIQSQLGYPQFFLWVLLCCVPSLVVAAFLRFDTEQEPQVVNA